jgi:membrane-bound lytic murein transglycosylase C
MSQYSHTGSAPVMKTAAKQINWPCILIGLALSACANRVNESHSIQTLDRIAEQIPSAETGDPLRVVQQDAEKHLSIFCAQFWGNGNVWLPTKKQWVYYGDGWTSRGRVDFENGEIQAQAVIDPDKDVATALPQLRTIVDEAIEDRPADMARHDSTMRYVKRLAAKRGITLESVPSTPEPTTAEPVLAGVVEPGAVELSPSTLTSKSIIGSTGKRWTQVTHRIPFKPGYLQTLAAPYTDQVRQQAEKFHLTMPLIFAVIEVESAFNPRATSPVPAYGLMQIVPTKAGQDAYQHVYGVRDVPGPEFLYNPANNISLGSAYLSLLDSNYLKNVEDPQNRLYATIAAYNTGVGNLARAFGTSGVNNAVQKINGLPADTVYQQLREQLPFQETRKYLVKVTEAQLRYQNLGPGERAATGFTQEQEIHQPDQNSVETVLGQLRAQLSTRER